ncbi:MAG TPA: pyridoxamine 5'-phosphate oxidase family protein [Nitrososphaeraceae archaeon]|jgi:PPOX class probable F420-dependent enzyme|nr:pyridoxamine 5'-phosphate oxidase family protein [Nitrososphaeraceae archaeon]
MPSEDLQRAMAAVTMSKEEMNRFLSTPRLARIATIDENGKPHIVPVWYYYDGTNILVPTMKGTKRARNMQKNPYVSIVIDTVEGKPEDISYLNAKAIIVEGKAEIKDDDGGSFAKKMYEIYSGKKSLASPMVQLSVSQPRHILIIKPTKVISWDLGKFASMK